MRRKLILFVSLVALIASVAPPAQAATATAPSIAWQPCAENPAVDCGTVTVPLDWGDPGGEKIELALARRKATDPSARIGSLVVNPGGPGGSGKQIVLRDRLPFSSDITSRFDIVGFDPRGVAGSHPILCSQELAAQAPDPFLKSQADFDRLLAFNARYKQDCRARTGPLFDHVDAASVARDLDVLRAALGDDKLSFYAISYGTLFGQLYAERYPDRVRALALDSNMDHSLGTRDFLDTQAWTTQDSFNEFVKWCDATSSCALHGKDIRAFWAGLLARADRGELHYPGEPETPLTKLLLIYETTGAFFGPDWADLAEFLVAVDSGEGTAKSSLKPLVDEEVINDATQAFCQDYLLPISDYREYAAHLASSRRIAPDMQAGPEALATMAACLGQQAPIPDPQHRLNVSGPTVLVANGLHDPSTGYNWALSTAEQLGRAGRLFTYEGWGHRIYDHGECAVQGIDRYLISLDLPAKGARCPAVPPTASTLSTYKPAPGPVPGLPGWVRQ
ncbi:alpha/beta fold hydrolase [Nonomuraea sp. CA-141351]|uniref:alpha/beta fold hydrolase n=1 Tax=Nonomuraea sp. CA-141351 TaxID=3239996 RepID=UPI003D89DBBF